MRDHILEIFFDGDDEELIQSRLFLTKSTGSTSSDGLVSAYFDSPEDREEAAALLKEFELQKVERERVDWLEVYQQSLEPIVIGERFVVAPDASLLPPGGDRLTIIVPQEQAFGTGSHETTSLCIEMLEWVGSLGSSGPRSLGTRETDGATEEPRTRGTGGLQTRRGLDVGSGSGILAIAMLRLGASNVIAFDNDVDAYGALRDNNLRNEVDVTIFIGSIEALRGGAFDVVTMNIIPEVILPLLPQVVSRMADGAHLILSGILLIARDTVVEAALGYGIELVAESEKGEWWAGVFRR
jgi:ribosomal protein L11 methyltransferase